MAFYPLDDAAVVKYVRAILGGIDSETLPDDAILVFWHMALADTPDNEPLALYRTIYNVVFFHIIPDLLAQGAADGGSLSEKEGSVSITRVWGKTLEAWWMWLKEFENRPPIPNLDFKDARPIIINGVRNDEYETIASAINSRNGRAFLGQNGESLVRSRNSGFVMRNGRWGGWNGFYR